MESVASWVFLMGLFGGAPHEAIAAESHQSAQEERMEAPVSAADGAPSAEVEAATPTSPEIKIPVQIFEWT